MKEIRNDASRSRYVGNQGASQVDFQELAIKIQNPWVNTANNTLDFEKGNFVVNDNVRSSLYGGGADGLKNPVLDLPKPTGMNAGSFAVSAADAAALSTGASCDILEELMNKLGGVELDNTDAINPETRKRISTILTELFNTELPESTGNVLFDLYAMIALLIQASQKLRDAAREVRQAENQAMQQSIQIQADLQEEAAEIGLICSCVVSCLQIAAQVVCMGMQSAASAKQVKIAAGSEAKVNAALTEQAQAKQNLRAIDSRPEIQAKIDANNAIIGDKNKILQANTKELTANSTKIIENNKLIESNNAEIKSNGSIEEIQQKINENGENNPNNIELNKQIDAINEKNAPLIEKNTILKKDNEVLEARNKVLNKEINDAVSGKTNAQEENASNNEKIEDVDAGKYGSKVDNENKIEEKKYEADMGRDLTNNKEMIEARGSENKWRLIGDMVMGLGNMGQGVVKGIADLKQAEATRKGADLKRQEEGLDQIKDLFNLAMDVIRKVLELYNSIYQVESSSMRDAITA